MATDSFASILQAWSTKQLLKRVALENRPERSAVPKKDQSKKAREKPDETTEHSFDDLAKEIASGALPRRKALKLMGAAILGTVVGSWFPGVAEARSFHNRRRFPNHKRRRRVYALLCLSSAVGYCPTSFPTCCPPSAGGGCCSIGYPYCCPPPSSGGNGSCCSIDCPNCCPAGSSGPCCPSGFPDCCPPSSSAECCPSGFSNCCPAGSRADCCVEGFPNCCPPGSAADCCPSNFPNCCPSGSLYKCCPAGTSCSPNGCLTFNSNLTGTSGASGVTGRAACPARNRTLAPPR